MRPGLRGMRKSRSQLPQESGDPQIFQVELNAVQSSLQCLQEGLKDAWQELQCLRGRLDGQCACVEAIQKAYAESGVCADFDAERFDVEREAASAKLKDLVDPCEAAQDFGLGEEAGQVRVREDEGCSSAPGDGAKGTADVSAALPGQMEILRADVCRIAEVSKAHAAELIELRKL